MIDTPQSEKEMAGLLITLLEGEIEYGRRCD